MAPRLTLKITPQADADIEEIWLYSAETWSVAQADSYLANFYAKFQTLTEMPQIGREYPNISPPIRIYPIGRHFVIYQIEDDLLNIIRVLHQRRHWQILFDK